jgi:hypothetical protein
MPPPNRRPSFQRRRRKLTPRVKIVPYVVPTTRRPPDHPIPLTVPTRWVKNIIAVFLLPWCAILTQTFFTAFTRATLHQRFWAGAEFWFFSLGGVLWLIAFFGLPRPVIVYVFGHELTHALWVWLMGGRVSKFRVGGDGGHIVTNRTNFWIALVPYFFPLYSVLAILVYGVASFFINVAPYGQLLFAIIGATWAFHFTFTGWMIPKKQSDLSDHGVFFSLVFIYLMNLALLSTLLIIASPQITFTSFGVDLVDNLRGFSEYAGGLMNRFARGHQPVTLPEQ